ncbi:hypothetical protein COU58_04180 [Candidatus Pacearchaeota archaeon CG10_big_fil_rev_8_21_14_0_10_32_42]|nr:MAG: hypothetical protein COU58_04180 [Candidatus Pacearchaeota archaeon CG10_big_fil_rev_8_21_14_0_10_32_42]
MREVDKVLDKNEKIFWEGKPKFWPFFVTGNIPSFIFGLVWLAFLAPFIFLNSNTGFEFSFGFNLFLLPFLLVGLWMIVGMPVYKLLLYPHLFYSITSKRVIIQKGVIGRDFEYIDFDQITNAEVNVGFWDKILGNGTGSIRIFSAGSFNFDRSGKQISKPYTISNIENPYEIFKLFKKLSHAIKTDIQFPNQYRPSKNPGYNTNFNPKS